MNLLQAIQTAMIEHREARDTAGSCIGCRCGKTWALDDALPAYGQHITEVLVDAITIDLAEPASDTAMWDAALREVQAMWPPRTVESP